MQHSIVSANVEVKPICRSSSWWSAWNLLAIEGPRMNSRRIGPRRDRCYAEARWQNLVSMRFSPRNWRAAQTARTLAALVGAKLVSKTQGFPW